MPAVLVEIGFLDHPEEGPYLVSEEGRETIATALARAIEDLRARELRGRRDPAITSRHTPHPRLVPDRVQLRTSCITAAARPISTTSHSATRAGMRRPKCAPR